MEALFVQLSDSVQRARTLEDLTRPLLEMLEVVTGMESTYLTSVDIAAGLQHVIYAHNAHKLQIPEGLSVTWGESLCKRALDERQTHTEDVGVRWGDVEAARDLGIHSFVSTPVRTDEGQLHGTLCAASARRQPLSNGAGHVLQLFARLIEQHVARERLVEKLQRANDQLQTLAMTDALTGLPNRRALMPELGRLISLAQRTGNWLIAGALDLDGFKQINDTHGHGAGDDFLRAVGARLQGSLRGGDVLARMGGDEFLVVGLGPRLSEDGEVAAQLLRQRLTQATLGQYRMGPLTLDYAGASVGVVCVDPHQGSTEDVLRSSDAAMYRAKLARRPSMPRH